MRSFHVKNPRFFHVDSFSLEKIRSTYLSARIFLDNLSQFLLAKLQLVPNFLHSHPGSDFTLDSDEECLEIDNYR